LRTNEKLCTFVVKAKSEHHSRREGCGRGNVSGKRKKHSKRKRIFASVGIDRKKTIR